MRKNKFLLCFLLLPTFVYADSVPDSIKKWTKPLSLLNLTVANNALTLVINKDKVTSEMYESIIGNSICMSLVDKPKSWGKAKIKKIYVLNKFAVQGYVFNGGEAECSRMGKMTSDEFKVKVIQNITTMN